MPEERDSEREIVLPRTTTRDELDRVRLRQERQAARAETLRDDLDEVRTFQRRAVAGVASLVVAALAALGGGVSLLRESIAAGVRRDERTHQLEERVRRLEQWTDQLRRPP